MKTLLALLLLIPSFSKSEEKKYGYWVSDTFLKCPNLLDVLIDSKLLDYEEQILDKTNELSMKTTYLIKKENEIYRYEILGLIQEGKQSCHKLFRNQSEAMKDDEVLEYILNND